MKDNRIRYSRRDHCFWIDIPEGLISCNTKAEAVKFLALYDKHGMDAAVKEYLD